MDRSTAMLEQDPAATYRIRDLLKDLARFLRPYKRPFILGTLSRVVADLAWLYPAYGIGLVVDILVRRKPEDSAALVWTLIAIFFAAVLIRYTGHFFGKRTVFRIAERMSLDLQAETIAKLFQLDMAWHERENAGNKLKKIQKGSDGINRILRVWVGNVIEIAVNFIGITVIVARTDLRIGAILAIFVFLYAPLSMALLRKASRLLRQVNIKEEEMHGLFFEALNNIRSVKVMGMAMELGRRVRDIATGMLLNVDERIQSFQGRNFILGVFAYSFRIIGIVAIIFGILNGRYEIGFLVLFNLYFNNMRESVEELATISEEVVTSKNALARATSILKEPLNIDLEEGKLPFPADWKEIRLKKVTFGYGSEPILRNVSFNVKRGEKIGIVGLSGAGKSTIFKLLLKERENYEGDISYDDAPLRDISKEDYFKHVAVVLQETEVFNFSLRDNVTITNMAAAGDKAMLDKALEVAHIEEFLHKLPRGVETLIGEKGVKLSGGEKQRLGIARAIFRSPQIFFLDEATSHLDLESEEKIRDSLARFFKDVTAIVIAHRLTTIKEMDRILVLQDGRIIEDGSWNALMRKRGRFRELWDKQGI